VAPQPVVEGAAGDAQRLGGLLDAPPGRPQDALQIVLLVLPQRDDAIFRRGRQLRTQVTESEVFAADHLARRRERGALENVAQLADVSGPPVALECALRIVVQAERAPASTGVAR